MTLRKQGILLFCLLMFCYGYVHQHMGWNQNSRLDLLHALFVQKTFKIDAYHENTGDKSVSNGHYYSDKAPGIVFLAMPAFGASVAILKALDIPLDSPRGWVASSWITTAGSVGWITALGGVALFAFLSKLVGQRYALITILAVFLGSSPFPYATMLFSHAAVIGLICIALWAIADPIFWSRMIRPGATLEPLGGRSFTTPGIESGTAVACPSDGWLKRYLLAGVCCGLAIASEYTAALAAGGVLALAFLTHWRRGVLLAVAAIPPLLLVPIYNRICFGGPLAFGYHHLALTQFQAMNQGLFGITFPPKANAAYLILLSPERGLLFWTPFFLMAFVGLKSLLDISPKLFWISFWIVVLQVFCISGYYMPSGGAALGPRHLAPIIPFIAMATALGAARWPRIGLSLGYLSVLLTGLATLIEAMPSDGLANPLVHLYIPRVLEGTFAHNLGAQVGLPQAAALGLIVAMLVHPYWMLSISADSVGFGSVPRSASRDLC